MAPYSSGTPWVGSVFHPSDFSEASENAFSHALAVALLGQTPLTILNVSAGSRTAQRWERFPAVRRTLERWGLLEEGSPRSAVFEQLAVRVRKVSLESRSPLDACLEYLHETPTDLIVLGTGRRKGIPGWLRGSVAEALSRKSTTATLFVPEGARGIVSPETGYIDLRRILVAVGRRPNSRAAIDAAVGAARVAGEGNVEISILHVGEDAVPLPTLPEDVKVTLAVVKRPHLEVTEAIVAEARRREADLVVMTTEGHNSIVDLLKGSTTEQVLRRISCPLLAIPAS
jgi:nucleotide-binding universal stress UspA family protein